MTLDTSGVLAALFPDQRHHRECAAVLLQAESARVLSPFVLAELDYLIAKHAGIEAELAFLEDVGNGAYELAPFSDGDVDAARRIIEQYRDLRLGLADASIVVLAGRYGSRDVLTLDERNFRAIRPPGRRSFRILPADC